MRLDVYPDGGMARLRLWGRPTAEGRRQLGHRWFEALPPEQAVAVLVAAGAGPDEARAIADSRPRSGAQLPDGIRRLLDGG